MDFIPIICMLKHHILLCIQWETFLLITLSIENFLHIGRGDSQRQSFWETGVAWKSGFSVAWIEYGSHDMRSPIRKGGNTVGGTTMLERTLWKLFPLCGYNGDMKI